MTKRTGKPIGRPPEPVPADIAERILDGLYVGKSLTAICAEPGMPKIRTISEWKAKDSAFAAAFAHARSEGAGVHWDQAGEIVARATPEDWQVCKLQAEHAYKTAKVYCPSVYGDNATVQHAGGVTLIVETGVPRRTEVTTRIDHSPKLLEDQA